MKIAVLGVDSDLPAVAAAERLRGARLVVGGQRHLDVYADAIHPDSAAVAIGGDLAPTLDAIAACQGQVVVLASGDPGFFGVVRALEERFGRDRLDVVPAVSSVAAAFGRVGLAWDDAVVVSAHGRDLRRAVNVARAYPKVAILTAPGAGPEEIAVALAGLDRTFVVAERLGSAQERIVTGDKAQIAATTWLHPNVVLVLDESRLCAGKGAVFPRLPTPDGWGLDEAAFLHRDGMVTKPEVRAVVLARLGPGPGDMVWDIGAGSGSVAIECARFGAAVIAVDSDPEATRLVAANAERHGVAVQVLDGAAAALLSGLADPDAVFVGGSGDEFPEILTEAGKRAKRAVVLALASVERIEPAKKSLQDSGFEVEVIMLQTSRLRGIGTLNGFVAANPVFIVSGRRP